MSEINVKFSNGHEFKVTGTVAFDVDAYVEEYLKDNPGVRHVSTEYLGENPEIVEYDEEGNSTRKTIDPETIEELSEEDKRLFTEDNVFVMDEYLKFTGKTEGGEDGTVKGMDEATFLETLDRMNFLRMLITIKHGQYNTFIDTPVSEITYEMIENALGNKGVVGAYSEKRERWEVPVYLRDGMLIIQDRKYANAQLRAYIYRVTGVYFVNSDLIDTMTSLWKKVNQVDADPGMSKEYIDRLLAEQGTSMEDIEVAYATEATKH